MKRSTARHQRVVGTLFLCIGCGMPRRAKIALVAIVLIAGLVLAWRFRKPHGAQSPPMVAADPSTAPTIAGDGSTLFNADPAAARRSSAPPLDLSATPASQSALPNPSARAATT